LAEEEQQEPAFFTFAATGCSLQQDIASQQGRPSRQQGSLGPQQSLPVWEQASSGKQQASQF